uniref:Beta-defensin n=1 Tax=Taeniopygia guttata TaxID=59729 RepID=H1A5I6_TAEGU
MGKCETEMGKWGTEMRNNLSPSPLPGYGKFRKTCAPMGYCSPKCRVMDLKYTSGDCKYSCCIPTAWKGK